MNPLLVSLHQPPVFLNSGPIEIEGNLRKYDHVWLHVKVEAQGEEYDVLIDPTIAQFDMWFQDGTAVWHKYKTRWREAISKYDLQHGCIQGVSAATQIFCDLFVHE